MKTSLLIGGKFSDHRGVLQFVNDNNPGNYRRFYLITNTDTTVIRAWQGHQIEEKAFYAINGSFTIAVVTPYDFANLTDKEPTEIFNLTNENGNFLRVAGGSFTGIKANTPNATLLVLSGLDVEASKKDDYRQPKEKWVNWETI